MCVYGVVKQYTVIETERLGVMKSSKYIGRIADDPGFTHTNLGDFYSTLKPSELEEKLGGEREGDVVWVSEDTDFTSVYARGATGSFRRNA